MAKRKGNEIKQTNSQPAKTGGASSYATRRNPDEQSSWLASPYDLIQRFGTEMDRVLEDLGIKRELGNFANQVTARPFLWSPAVEIIERDGQLVVRADLPGLNKNEIKVHVSDDAITIEGERKQEHEESGEGFYRSERRYGHFHRHVPLPSGVDTEKVTARFRNGVLEIAMEAPTVKERKARTLEIADESVPAKARAAGR